MPTIPNLSLKQPTFATSFFTPVQYQYQGQDLSVLERSLAQKEARRNQAIQQKTALDQALSTVEQKLNSAEAEWFNNYKTNINNQIADGLDSGDYGAAFRTATMLAGDVAKDSAILSRIKANEDYTKWETNLQSRLDKGEISQDIQKWALAMNPYKFTETTNASGQVVGGKLATPNQVYGTADWIGWAAQAASLNRPDVISTTTGNDSTNPALYNAGDNGVQKINGQLGSASSSYRSQHQLEEVTADEIFNTVSNLINVPDLKNRAIQDWEVAVWNYQQKLDNGELTDSDKQALMAQGLWRNGSPVSLQEYINEKAKLFASALGYKKETTSELSGGGFTLEDSGITGDRGEGDYAPDPNNPGGSSVSGSRVRKTINAMQSDINNIQARANNRFSSLPKTRQTNPIDKVN